MGKAKYYLAALGAFIIWGFFSLALKPLDSYASLDILFYRVFLCAVIMLFISLLFRSSTLKDNITRFKNLVPVEKKKVIFLTLAGGLLLTFNWFFFIFVMNHISIKAASFAYLVCPIITTVFAFFILQEKLNKWQWTAVVMSICSCVILSFNHMQDIAYSLIVASSYALYLVSQRKNNVLDKFLSLTIQILFSAIILIPFYPSFSMALPSTTSFYVYIFVIAVLFTIIPLFLNLYALKGVNSSTVGIFLYINPLINFAIALLYFGEKINSIQILAYAVIFISIIVFNAESLFRKKFVNSSAPAKA